MPRYFFDVEDGKLYTDEQGIECMSLHEARRTASYYAGELLRDMPDSLWRDGSWRVRVRDQRGRIIFTVALSADVPSPRGTDGGEPVVASQDAGRHL